MHGRNFIENKVTYSSIQVIEAFILQGHIELQSGIYISILVFNAAGRGI